MTIIFYYFSFHFFSNLRKFIAKKEIVYQKKSRIITTFGHQIPGKDVENTDSVQLNPDEQGLAKSGSSDISAFAINNSENNLKSEIFLLDSMGGQGGLLFYVGAKGR